ncbi:MAG: TadE/TadG family type IV pilus assembly protein [Planctomycetaceae bacterium]
MELVFVLPILLMLLVGLLEFSLLFFARGDVVEACRVAARQATLPGATPEEIEDAALTSLPSKLRRGAEVAVEMGVHSGDPVIVAVRVPMSAAAPDLLWPVGFSLQNNDLTCETRMVKE